MAQSKESQKSTRQLALEKIVEILETDKVFYVHDAFATSSNTRATTGHYKSYLGADVLTRYHRQQGEVVLNPFSVHTTGVDAEKFLKRVKEDRNFGYEAGMTDHEIDRINTPESLARYMTKQFEKSYRKADLSFDFGTNFRTLDPIATKFIGWQSRRLLEKGLIAKEKYVGPYCHQCGIDISISQEGMDLDTKESDLTTRMAGYDLVFFPIKDQNNVFIVTSTERPENMLAAQSIGINPDGRYVEATVANGGSGEERWIVDARSVQNLQDQGFKLRFDQPHSLIANNTIKSLESLVAINPLTGAELEIYGSRRVNDRTGTGIIFRNPNADINDYWDYLEHHHGMTADCIPESIISDASGKPISVIATLHALKAKQKIKYKIKDLPDESRKEKYVKTINRAIGSHEHELNKNSPMYVGDDVRIARNKVRDTLEERGMFRKYYQLSGRVYCRMGHRVRTNAGEAWRVHYDNPTLIGTVRDHVSNEDFITVGGPGKGDDRKYAEHLFRDIFPTFGRRIAAWQKGIGSDFAFEELGTGWKNHSLYDSTIYMLEEPLNLFVKAGKVKASQFNDAVFDYVILGEGDKEEIVKTSGINEKTLNEMKTVIEKVYPVDWSFAGSEHMYSHLPLSLLMHAAVLPEEMQIRNMYLNGLVNSEVPMRDKDGHKVYKDKEFSGKAIDNLDPLNRMVAEGVYTNEPVVLGYIESKYIPIKGTIDDMLSGDPKLRTKFVNKETLEEHSGDQVLTDVHSRFEPVTEVTKMSKSNPDSVKFLNEWVKKIGSDALRLYLTHASEFLEDTTWRDIDAYAHKSTIEGYRHKVIRNLSHADDVQHEADHWLQYMVNSYVEKVTGLMDNMRYRSVIHHAFYGLNNELKEYQNRINEGNSNRKRTGNKAVLDRFYTAQSQMISPIIPKTANFAYNKLHDTNITPEVGWAQVDEKLEFSADIIGKYEGILMGKLEEFLSEEKLAARRLKFVTNVTISVPDEYTAAIIRQVDIENMVNKAIPDSYRRPLKSGTKERGMYQLKQVHPSKLHEELFNIHVYGAQDKKKKAV